MPICAFYHLKGGVGKTTAAVNIAYLAARTVGLEGTRQQPRCPEQPLADLLESGAEEDLRHEGVLAGLVLDDRPHLLIGTQAVGQTGGQEGAGRDADVGTAAGQVEAVEGVVQGLHGSDLVDRAAGRAAGQGEPDRGNR